MKSLHFIFFQIVFSLALNAQISYTPAELFDEGQYFFQRKDYKEALYFYKQLVLTNKEHANFNFKAGECLLNIPGQEHLAVPYLEIAIKNTVPKKEYNKRSFSEKNAPLHAWFFLGNAYRISGQLDKALRAYDTFLNSPYFTNNYNYNVVENEMKSCERAKIIQDAPINFVKTAFDTMINTSNSEFNPVISADGKTLVFVRRLKFYDAIFVARKTEQGWFNPHNINPEIVSDGDYYPTGISSDGMTLLLVHEENDNSDIYFSTFNDLNWSKAKKITGKINSAAYENYASFGPNDKTIVFTSNSTKSKGGYDIFVSKLKSDGSWGKGKNLGKVVNTDLDEETPVLCGNGKVLFFSSKGHYSMGGLDIFYTYLENNRWSIPRNIGYPISTTRDDSFFHVEEGCNTALFSIIDTITGTSDIYMVELKDPLAVP